MSAFRLPSAEFAPDRAGPLAGLHVPDVSRLVAGNMLSLQLADFGAEVIKIEDAELGEHTREVLRGAGLTEEQIRQLAASGVIRT